MHRNVFLTFVLVCCLSTSAFGAVTVTAGDHIISPGPGQVVPILLSSDVPQGVQSADLGLAVSADGLSGPFMTNVDMTSPGTVFGDAPGGNSGDAYFEAFPTRNQLDSVATLAGDTAPAAGGVLAFVTLDASGFAAGQSWEFLLTYLPFALDTSTSSLPDPPGQSTTLVHGSITIVPEPGSILLGLFAVAGLGLVAIRRRVRKSA